MPAESSGVGTLVSSHTWAPGARRGLDGLIDVERPVEEHRGGDAVAHHDRNPDTGRLDHEIGSLEDLAGLVDELPLLVGVALLGERCPRAGGR